MTADIALVIKNISGSLRGKTLDEALSIIEAHKLYLPDTFEEHLGSLVANIYWQHSHKAKAINILAELVNKYPARPHLLYNIGQHLVDLGKYSDAVSPLTECIDLEIKSKSHWYLQACLLLRSLCYAKLGKNLSSENDLLSVENEETITWLESIDCLSKKYIRNIINN